MCACAVFSANNSELSVQAVTPGRGGPKQHFNYNNASKQPGE